MRQIKDKLREEYRNINIALWNASNGINPLPARVLQSLQARWERLSRIFGTVACK